MTAVLPSPWIDLRGFGLAVPGRSLIHDASFTVAEHELWGIVGANGAGKSLFLHTLAGLRPVDHGTVAVAGRSVADWPLADAARVRGFLPQSTHDAFAMPAIDVVMMGRHPYLTRWTWEGEDDRAKAREALEAVGLADMAGRDITTLSGGERQRVAIAALLAQAVPLMLLDEPVSHLDLHHQIQVMQHLAGRVRAGGAAMVSLHDLNLARRFATHVMLFRGGGRIDAGSADEVMREERLTEAFGHPVARVSAGSRTLFVAD